MSKKSAGAPGLQQGMHPFSAQNGHKANIATGPSAKSNLGPQTKIVAETSSTQLQGDATAAAYKDGQARSPLHGWLSNSDLEQHVDLPGLSQPRQHTHIPAASASTAAPDGDQHRQKKHQSLKQKLAMQSDEGGPHTDDRQDSHRKQPQRSSELHAPSPSRPSNGSGHASKSHQGQASSEAPAAPARHAASAQSSRQGLTGPTSNSGLQTSRASMAPSTSCNSGPDSQSDLLGSSAPGHRVQDTRQQSMQASAAGLRNMQAPQLSAARETFIIPGPEGPENPQASAHLRYLLQRSLQADSHELGSRSSSSGIGTVPWHPQADLDMGQCMKEQDGQPQQHKASAAHDPAVLPDHKQVECLEEPADIIVQHVRRAVGPAHQSRRLMLQHEQVASQRPASLPDILLSESVDCPNDPQPAVDRQALAEAAPDNEPACCSKVLNPNTDGHAEAAGSQHPLVPAGLQAAVPASSWQPDGHLSEPLPGNTHASTSTLDPTEANAIAAGTSSAASLAHTSRLVEASRTGMHSQSPGQPAQMSSPGSAQPMSTGCPTSASSASAALEAHRLPALRAINTKPVHHGRTPAASLPMSAEQQLFAGMQGYRQGSVDSLPAAASPLEGPSLRLEAGGPSQPQAANSTIELLEQQIAAQLALHEQIAAVDSCPATPPSDGHEPAAQVLLAVPFQTVSMFFFLVPASVESCMKPCAHCIWHEAIVPSVHHMNHCCQICCEDSHLPTTAQQAKCFGHPQHLGLRSTEHLI